jgi:hypothetical protein
MGHYAGPVRAGIAFHVPERPAAAPVIAVLPRPMGQLYSRKCRQIRATNLGENPAKTRSNLDARCLEVLPGMRHCRHFGRTLVVEWPVAAAIQRACTRPDRRVIWRGF